MNGKIFLLKKKNITTPAWFVSCSFVGGEIASILTKKVFGDTDTLQTTKSKM
jgi:uncharacterized membrane protein YbjE (DUF340 family)